MLTVFGAGLQASLHIDAMCAVRELTCGMFACKPYRTHSWMAVYIVNRSCERAEALKGEVAAVHPALEIRCVALGDLAAV